MRWDPAEYGRFGDERARPFTDLMSRVGASAPRRVVDIGCGSGELTATLAQRWPSAVVEGIDSSPEMIAACPPDAVVGFSVQDAAEWSMPPDTDVLVSNAVLQWVPSHRALLASWAAALPSGGWLAFQVPRNFDSPAHALMRRLAAAPRWEPRLSGVLRHHDAVASPQEYAGLLLDCALRVDAWETTYLHLLSGEDPVLRWLRGTGLRPVLAALSPTEAEEFQADFATALRSAYPATPHGTFLPYRRVFVVAQKA
jgi:trans-aconitate 2-methyltransferase